MWLTQCDDGMDTVLQPSERGSRCERGRAGDTISTRQAHVSCTSRRTADSREKGRVSGARLESDLGLGDQRPAGDALRDDPRGAALAAVVMAVSAVLVAREFRVRLEEVALDAALAASAAATAGGGRRPAGASGRRVFIVGHAAGGPRERGGLRRWVAAVVRGFYWACHGAWLT